MREVGKTFVDKEKEKNSTKKPQTGRHLGYEYNLNADDCCGSNRNLTNALNFWDQVWWG